MTILQRIATATVFGFGLLAAAATAQQPPADIVAFELDSLEDEERVGAEIFEIDREDRTLTVRLDETEEWATMVVPQGVEIVLVSPPNELERQIEFNDLHPGQNITIEGYEVEGLIRVRIVGIAA